VTPDNTTYVDTPPYRVCEATEDGMSATLWRGNQQTHTIWCSTADAANQAADIVASYFNITAECDAEDVRVQKLGPLASLEMEELADA